VAKSRNLGIKKAKGKYIAILDADDISLPDRLKKQFDYLEKHKDIFLIGASAIHIDKLGKMIGKFDSVTNEYFKKIIVGENPIYNSTIFFRNENIFTYRKKIVYAEDYDAFLLLDSKGKKMVNLPEYLIKYRILESSLSRSKRVKLALFKKKAQEFYKQRLSKGFDEYDFFDPNDILEIDLMNKKSKKSLLIGAIKNSLKYYNDLVFYSKKLIKYYGSFHWVLVFYLITFIGENKFNKFIRVIQNFKQTFGLYR
jgi:glycosyltransferase involved in cell wall biosynthesis